MWSMKGRNEGEKGGGVLGGQVGSGEEMGAGGGDRGRTWWERWWGIGGYTMGRHGEGMTEGWR